MTNLSKELITSNKRTSPHFSDELPVEKTCNDRFKELMQPEQEEENALETPSEEGASLNALISQHLCSMALGIQTEAGPAAVSPSTGSSHCSSSPGMEIAEIFEKMASTMLILSSSKETDTTLFLEGPKFTASVFFGTRITIKEFSSAPKAFNVEIVSHPAAINLLAEHKGALLSAFESGRFPFTIHRLETHLHPVEDNVFSEEFDSREDQDQKKDDS